MDGLECSEISLSSVDLGDRIDSDFFTKDYLSLSKTLFTCKTTKLGELGKTVASAFYPAATHLYEAGDTPFVRCVDCIDFPFITKDQESFFEKIPYDFAISNSGIALLHRNDIVITKVGTPCYASVVQEYDELSLSRTVLGIKNISPKVHPFYLLVFLRSKYGFQQLLRQRELTIQYQLTLSRVKNIDVFLASTKFQTTIADFVRQFTSFSSMSFSLYNEALNSLERVLGFRADELPVNTETEKPLSETLRASGRLDAEYYQPKYDSLFSVLSKHNTKLLGLLTSIKKSIEPGSEAYCDEGIPFIRVSDMNKWGIIPPSIHIPANSITNMESLYPKKDTILLSKDGSVGLAYKVESDMEAITSGALLHLMVKDYTEILPDYLTLVLNSQVVSLQAERDASGAIIQHWKPSEIEKVVIPILNMDIQEKLADNVIRSFSLRRKSEQLLEAAKQAVEMAIEQSEESAIKWLKKVSDNMEAE